MREITSHIVNPVNDKLHIMVMDEPGAGGANHEYSVTGFDTGGQHYVRFQNGGIAEHGVNGITQEVLLAIVADRLESFQAGPFANGYNATALGHVKFALETLQSRTRERMSRGVEGRNVA